MTDASLFMRDQHIIYPHRLIEAPEVSIIMPTYCRNQSGLLSRAINSVRAQTFANWELIIIDDGSRDGSLDTIRELQRIDHRIIHVRHAYNSGLPAIRVNEGLILARAPYIAYQFDDDVWKPKLLDILLKQIRKVHSPALVYGKAQAFPPDSRIIGSNFAAGSSRLMDANFIANNSVLHSRECFEQYGMYDTHVVMRRVCDWMLWQRWSQLVPFYDVDVIVSQVSIGQDNAIGEIAPYDLLAYRIFNGLNREKVLLPHNWLHTEVDNLSPWADAVSLTCKNRMEQEHIQLWNTQTAHSSAALAQLQHAARISTGHVLFTRNDDNDHANTCLWKASSTDLQPPYSDTPMQSGRSLKRKRSLVVSKMHYDPSVDITFQHFNRIDNPLFQSFYVPLHQIDTSYMKDSDLVVLHRACYDFSVLQHYAAQQIGKPVIYLMDDDFLHLYQVSPEFHYLAPGENYYNQLLIHLQEADICVAYSDITADSIRPHNPRVLTLSTNIPGSYLKRPFVRNNGMRPFRIGYTGGNSRTEEFAQLWEAFQRLSQKYGEQIEFVFWGMNPHTFPTLSSPVSYVPFTYSYYEYLNRLMNIDIDLGVAPLDDSTRAKSGKCPIKYLEYTAAGTIGIYSDALPYRSITHQVTGWKVANTVQDWYEGIDTLIQMPVEARERIWQSAQEDVYRSFSTEKERIRVAAVAEAAILHHRFRDQRAADGKPCIVLLWNEPFEQQYALTSFVTALRAYAIEPLILTGSLLDNPEALVSYCKDHRIIHLAAEQLDQLKTLSETNAADSPVPAFTQIAACIQMHADSESNHLITLLLQLQHESTAASQQPQLLISHWDDIEQHLNVIEQLTEVELRAVVSDTMLAWAILRSFNDS
ncbi:glycosyltransferase [Paenibacillus sp. UMB4589-SE434]|uniref:glycosyltransferase n=1 Tax=Paenibacillus sp. UMB4589-SE434 TaxID=3046314 RepID=UPI00254F4C7D|nr:glycosyltransferase [Paenibacillus sp. UMB4589-SE434]MDK8182436.1 glycosyltransferase [Paenibacillus sp. UMB4589-SE434]